MGAGAGAALFAELARTSHKKERTLVFSIFSSMRQLGLIIGMVIMKFLNEKTTYKNYNTVGPAFNLFTRMLNFKLGPFTVMKYTAPGVSYH